MFDLSRLLNNISNNYDDAYSSYSDVRMFMADPQIAKSQYAASSYNAGFSTGRVLYYMLFTTEYEVNGTEPLDPFTTLSNYDPENYAAYTGPE